MKITQKRLLELQKKIKSLRVAVIGDLMLDGYFFGDVKRISPEAPVPVMEVGNEFYRFGGAANVALNIIKLGGVPVPFGVIGKDNQASIFSSLLAEANITSACLIEDESRPTTIKTRIIAHSQHVLRIDKESTAVISETLQQQLLDKLKAQINEFDAIILEDYNKGVLSEGLITKIIALARKHKKMVTVDPKYNNFFSYKHVTVFKPNRKEAEDMLTMKIRTSEEITLAGNKLLSKLKADYVLLTLGEGGMAIFSKGAKEQRMPTKARKVADVSGAGDTVIATLTMALAAGADILEASYLANYAAGIVCGEVGIAPIESDVLFSTVINETK